jgi:protease I
MAPPRSTNLPRSESTPLRGRKVAVLATDGFEQVELSSPVEALRAAGAEVSIVSLAAGPIQGFHHFDKGDRFPVDLTVSNANAATFDALVLPGGLGNPDALRANPEAVNFVRAFHAAHKIIAAICHGPWLLAEANVLKGRRITSYPSIKTDLINAGATWTDEQCVVDQGPDDQIFVTSRSPADLEEFNAAVIEEITHAPDLAQQG